MKISNLPRAGIRAGEEQWSATSEAKGKVLTILSQGLISSKLGTGQAQGPKSQWAPSLVGKTPKNIAGL